MFGMAKKGNLSSAIWYDLTSGDGIGGDEPGQWVKTCSPGLLTSWACGAPKNVPVAVHLYEIQKGTYDRLVESLHENLAGFKYLGSDAATDRWHGSGKYGNVVDLVAHSGSGSAAEISYIRSHKTSVIALNDPNAITTWAMRPTFSSEVQERTWMFRSLSTLGCNPSGLKRLTRDERAAWFDLIDSVMRSLPNWRDLLLCAIQRDAAQWAYLIETPDKWRSSTSREASKAFAEVGRALDTSWYRMDTEDFRGTMERLFLTVGERSA